MQLVLNNLSQRNSKLDILLARSHAKLEKLSSGCSNVHLEKLKVQKDHLTQKSQISNVDYQE